MIQLTPSYTLYLPRLPHGPSFFGRWTIVGSIFLLCGIIARYIRRKKIVLIVEIPELPEVRWFVLETWIAELRVINTSIRTPHDKAKAILAHLMSYLWYAYDPETQIVTLREIRTMMWDDTVLFRPIEELYTRIYTDTPSTHQQIDTIVKTVIADVSSPSIS